MGIRGGKTNSFLVHIPVAAMTIGLALFLKLPIVELTVLLLCIGVVLAAEVVNSCLEHLAASVTSETDPHIRDALDIAAGAVLVVSLFAATIGLIIFVSAIAN